MNRTSGNFNHRIIGAAAVKKITADIPATLIEGSKPLLSLKTRR